MPKPNANTIAGKSDANGYSYGYGNSAAGDTDTYGYRDGDSTSGVADANTIGNPASADAEAAAHAVPTADAVSEWVRTLRELESNQELARRLASSLLLGGSTSLKTMAK